MPNRFERWVPVADYVNKRLKTLRWKQADLVRASTLSDPTVRGIMKPLTNMRAEPEEDTILKLCHALGWTDESVDQIFSGEAPTLIEVSQPDVEEDAEMSRFRHEAMREIRRLARLLEDLRAEVEELKRRPPHSGQESV